MHAPLLGALLALNYSPAFARFEPMQSVETIVERRIIDESLIQEITRRIVEAFHPRRIILFGGRARGDNRQDSDLDIFVEMESDKRPWQRRMQIASLFRQRTWPMDILVYTPEEVEERRDSLSSIIPSILREGRVLYHA